MINNYDIVDIFNLLFSINHINLKRENTFFTVSDHLVSGENSTEQSIFLMFYFTLKFVNISSPDI